MKPNKRAAAWLTAAVVVAATAVVILSGIDSGSQNFEREFSSLCSALEEGYSTADTKERQKDSYHYFLNRGFEAFDYLKEKAQTSGKGVITAEWLLSDIIRMQCGDINSIQKEYWITAAKNDCFGKTGPGQDYQNWCSIPENTVLQITGILPPDWLTCRMAAPMEDKKHVKTDHVEFWIEKQDIYFGLRDDSPLSFSSVNEKDAREYNHVIKSTLERGGKPGLGEQGKIFVHPSAHSSVAGLAYTNDLVRLKKDDCGKVIRSGAWVLIEKIPFYFINSHNMGWIREEHIREITEGMRPAQGFISGCSLIYQEPSKDSEVLNSKYPEIKRLKDDPLVCVHIIDSKNGWHKVSAGVNSFTGWIPEEDVHFTITDDVMRMVVNPESY